MMSEQETNLIHSTYDGNEKHRPRIVLAQLAAAMTQILFGGSSVVGSLGLPQTNPVLFGMIRDLVAGPLLCIISYGITRKLPELKHIKMFILPAFMIYLAQITFIVGIKLSDSIMAAAFTPGQSIAAVIIGLCLGTEKNVDIYKILGVLIGFSGALIMVVFGKHASNNGTFWGRFGGGICFTILCCASVLYLHFIKPLLKLYKSINIVSFCYIIASIFMVISQIMVASWNNLLNILCNNDCSNPWEVPSQAIYALIYFILFTSILCFFFMTWANQYTNPSVICAYSVLQPLTSVALSEFLILTQLVPECQINNDNNPDICLYGVNYADLGALGIIIGLFLVIYTDTKRSTSNDEFVN